mmetsp:Transcript_35465/g.6391  ORF Transcript_35465/g.6391 Transcript_35465/m.6391 type:complete len:94 (-) Transcript_35465:255-536(-)
MNNYRITPYCKSFLSILKLVEFPTPYWYSIYAVSYYTMRDCVSMHLFSYFIHVLANDYAARINTSPNSSHASIKNAIPRLKYSKSILSSSNTL